MKPVLRPTVQSVRKTKAMMAKTKVTSTLDRPQRTVPRAYGREIRQRISEIRRSNRRRIESHGATELQARKLRKAARREGGRKVNRRRRLGVRMTAAGGTWVRRRGLPKTTRRSPTITANIGAETRRRNRRRSLAEIRKTSRSRRRRRRIRDRKTTDESDIRRRSSSRSASSRCADWRRESWRRPDSIRCSWDVPAARRPAARTSSSLVCWRRISTRKHIEVIALTAARQRTFTRWRLICKVRWN